MDGYAVRAADVMNASDGQPVALPVLETVRAGQRPSRALDPRSAIRIMTGAPIPDGADTVIRVEDTDGGETTVVITRRARRRPQRSTARRRSARRRRRRFTRHGHRRGADRCARVGRVCARCQCTVARASPCSRPATSLSTSIASMRCAAAIASCRRTATRSRRRCARSAAKSSISASSPTTPPPTPSGLQGAAGCDLLITSGGVSVGAFDFTKDVLQSLGAELHLWRVRMRPGAPLGFGMLGAMPWLGLPGKSRVHAGDVRAVRATAAPHATRRARVFRRTIDVRTRDDVSLAAPLTHFMRAIVEWESDGRVGPVDRTAGIGSPHVDVARQRAARRPAGTHGRPRRRVTPRAAPRRARTIVHRARRLSRPSNPKALEASLSRRFRVVETTRGDRRSGARRFFIPPAPKT